MHEFMTLIHEFSPVESKSTMIDSGTPYHLNKESDKLPITGPSTNLIITATGDISQTTATAILSMMQLPDAARVTHILPNLQVSLMRVSILADNGCATIFHPHQNGVTVHGPDGVKIVVMKKALLKGWRDSTGLWKVPLANRVNEHAPHTIILDQPAPFFAINSVYKLPSTERVVRILHGALGIPTKATMLAAACNGNLDTFPGLTTENISKSSPDSKETWQKRHMRQSKQSVRSTKVIDEDAALQFKPTPGIKHQTQGRVLTSAQHDEKADVYQPNWPFPITSSKGNKYLMIACELDGNYIDAEPLKSKAKNELVTAYQSIFTRWSQTGTISPNWDISDCQTQFISNTNSLTQFLSSTNTSPSPQSHPRTGLSTHTKTSAEQSKASLIPRVEPTWKRYNACTKHCHQVTPTSYHTPPAPQIQSESEQATPHQQVQGCNSAKYRHNSPYTTRIPGCHCSNQYWNHHNG
jgi:hypothetical protein